MACFPLMLQCERVNVICLVLRPREVLTYRVTASRMAESFADRGTLAAVPATGAFAAVPATGAALPAFLAGVAVFFCELQENNREETRSIAVNIKHCVFITLVLTSARPSGRAVPWILTRLNLRPQRSGQTLGMKEQAQAVKRR